MEKALKTPSFQGFERIGATGFEPATSCSQSRRASQTAPRPVRHSRAGTVPSLCQKNANYKGAPCEEEYGMEKRRPKIRIEARISTMPIFSKWASFPGKPLFTLRENKGCVGERAKSQNGFGKRAVQVCSVRLLANASAPFRGLVRRLVISARCRGEDRLRWEFRPFERRSC